MSIRSVLKLGIMAAGIILIASCSKTPGTADITGEEAGVMSNGLGQLNSRFSGQEEGESYTSKAPHNQVYLFAFDNSSLAPKYIPSANAQADYLKSHPGARIMLAGHTDERGSREYNVALGERRANTVAEIMRLSGVSRDQIRVVSYGKERAFNFNHDENAHRQNRRVELIYEATR